MTPFTKIAKKLFIAGVTLSVGFSGITNVHACHGRGGGGYRGGQVYVQPQFYQRPVAPVVYQQPMQFPTRPVAYQQFPGTQQLPVANPLATPAATNGAAPAAYGLAQQPPVAQAGAQFAAGGQQQVPVQGQTAGVVQATYAAKPVLDQQISAPNQGPNGIAGQTPIATNPAISTAPVTNVAPPATGGPAAPVAPAVAPPAASTENSSAAEQSALEALAGFATDTTPVATQAEGVSQVTPTTTAEYIGNWTASLPNGTSVKLVLQPNGSFHWVASVNDKTTSFDGTYTFENGSLSLARSSDNQRLSGSLTSTGNNGFNFKLNGTNDSGLNFSRS